jgi:2OG-Fe(II) oxygenase superfamily
VRYGQANGNQHSREYDNHDKTQKSKITVQIYLNDGFVGGETAFSTSPNPEYKDKRRVAYVPKTGSALIFEHMIFHEGCLLVEGRKYALRSDIMYYVDH